MSLKSSMFAFAFLAGIICSATPAPAQEWWNPVSWFTPTRTYVARPVYAAPCPNGNCYPTTYGYQPTYTVAGARSCPGGNCSGNCANGSCTTGSCANGSCGASVMPYRANSANAPVGNNPQLVPASGNSGSRNRPSPFYQ